ncbi:sugar ABC transporter permease [Streptomyces sp. NPDC026672]|uniref:carbohydrate ABC transporter permease n=1 Tax=unclassified Streptomyces TaxID=2593676 RepID=UPI0033DEEF4A
MKRNDRSTGRGGPAGAPALGYVMIAPTAVLLCALILVPVGYSVCLALFRWQLTEIDLTKPFTGLDNFTHLFHDGQLRTALSHTALYVVGCVAAELLLGFVVVVALFDLTRGRKLTHSIVLLPMIIAPVVTSLLWRYLLDPQFGIVSQVMSVFGHDSGIDWFGSPRLALPSLMMVDVWQWTPFVILILHAGMLAIPEERFEAARVDGAGRWKVLRHVVIPALGPQLLLILLFRTMDTYRIFDTVFVLTKGGPGTSTNTLGLYTYRTGFSFFDMGYAMALSVFILVTIAVISAFYLRLLRTRDEVAA